MIAQIDKRFRTTTAILGKDITPYELISPRIASRMTNIEHIILIVINLFFSSITNNHYLTLKVTTFFNMSSQGRPWPHSDLSLAALTRKRHLRGAACQRGTEFGIIDKNGWWLWHLWLVTAAARRAILRSPPQRRAVATEPRNARWRHLCHVDVKTPLYGLLFVNVAVIYAT